VLLYCTALFAVLSVRSRIPRVVGAGAVFAQIAEGLALVRSNKRLIGVLVVTVIYNIFAWPFTSMIPVIGRDRLHLGPEGVGILASVDGSAPFVGALLMRVVAIPRWYGRIYLSGVVCYLISGDYVRAGPKPGAGGAALLLTGLGGAGFATMQATRSISPRRRRCARASSASSPSASAPARSDSCGSAGSPTASAPTNATAVTAIMGLLALAATWRWWKEI
jgi:hypothetical protein